MERLRQLQTNLSRAQKLMSINKAPRYVLVNVPAFIAQAVEHNQVALDSHVVVGKPQRATPAVSAKIVEVNFYPTWSVPDIVARNDLIPTIRKEPNYFYEQRFNVMRDWGASPLDPAEVDWASPQVVSYKFRQDPGPQNALGLVRINMPNKHAVYMHDTPLKALFSQSARAFSSGCVRVEQVFDLVAWLLGDQGWTLAKVEDQIDSGKKIDVKLKKPVPVHFVYLTAFAAGTAWPSSGPISTARTPVTAWTWMSRTPWCCGKAAPSPREVRHKPAPEATERRSDTRAQDIGKRRSLNRSEAITWEPLETVPSHQRPPSPEENMFGLSRLRAVEIGVALLLTLAAFLIGFRVLAEERGIRVSDAWARPTAGQSTTSAAYMIIANQGEGNDMLTAARTQKAEAIELHQTTMTAEGVMQMRQIKDGLPIEAGKTIELKPGGTHFMLLGLDGRLNAGETLLVTLEFAKAGAVEVTVPVSADAPAEQDGAGPAHH